MVRRTESGREGANGQQARRQLPGAAPSIRNAWSRCNESFISVAPACKRDHLEHLALIAAEIGIRTGIAATGGIMATWAVS